MAFRNLILVSILAAALCFTGCDSGGSKPSPKPTPTPTSTSGNSVTPTPIPTPIFPEGSGTEIDPYLIYTAAQLDQVRNGLDKCYRVMADINLSAYTNWNPIGTEHEPFYGHLDGDNHIISNLTIDRPGIESQGLFGCMNNSSEVSNLVLQNPNVSGYYSVGSLVGTMILGAVTNCSVTGTTTITSTAGQAGGLIGFESHGTVTNSSASVSVSSGLSAVGGLLGVNYYGTVTNCHATGNTEGNSFMGGLIGNNYGTVTLCYATGTVTGIGSNKVGIGGLVGENYSANISQSHATGNVSGTEGIGGLFGSNYGGSISRCYATGSVNGTRTVGGLVGRAYDSTITNSYATGSVTGDEIGGGLVSYCIGNITNSYAAGHVTVTTGDTGGLVGYIYGDITGCYYDTNTSGQTDTGNGDPKTTAEMKQQATFVGWDFTAIWDITTGYPFLR
ncbi:MAG TPA: GLUG motif-containing protein [Bacillota bacterium]|nr:GLUG motif-containing protein [Bacillota bacterium]